MFAFPPSELRNLTKTTADLIANVLTSNDRVTLLTVKILHHAIRDHACSENEAKTVWATIFAGALRANADVVEEQVPAAIAVEGSKTDQQVTNHVQEILDKLSHDDGQ